MNQYNRMRQKVNLDQWITLREGCLFIGIILPTLDRNSSNKPKKEQKKAN